MTIDEFWRKYNHCPLCEFYVRQGICSDCKWQYPEWYTRKSGFTIDKYVPTADAVKMMNREVGE